MADQKTNPVVSILLGLLLLSVSAVGALDLILNNQVWTKLDRMTQLFLAERDLVRKELVEFSRMTICTDREVARLKEQLKLILERDENGTGIARRGKP